LVVEAALEEVEEVKGLVKRCMESVGAGKVHVPLTVEIGQAQDWLGL